MCNEKNRQKTCYVYARKSNSDMNERSSFYKQLYLCCKYAESRGFLVLDVFGDYGVSGATLDRVGLQALLEKIEEDPSDYIVVADLSRLSRCLEDAVELVLKFKELNMHIRYADEY